MYGLTKSACSIKLGVPGSVANTNYHQPVVNDVRFQLVAALRRKKSAKEIQLTVESEKTHNLGKAGISAQWTANRTVWLAPIF
jgi:hypothetical protein